MAVILCPFLAIGAVMKIFEPTNYPAGDLRNEMAFRLVFYGAFITFFTIGFALSLRWLLNDHRLARSIAIEQPTRHDST
jgi:hypothetical protein